MKRHSTRRTMDGGRASDDEMEGRADRELIASEGGMEGFGGRLAARGYFGAGSWVAWRRM